MSQNQDMGHPVVSFHQEVRVLAKGEFTLRVAMRDVEENPVVRWAADKCGEQDETIGSEQVG